MKKLSSMPELAQDWICWVLLLSLWNSKIVFYSECFTYYSYELVIKGQFCFQICTWILIFTFLWPSVTLYIIFHFWRWEDVMHHGIPWINCIIKEIPREINNFLNYILVLCMKTSPRMSSGCELFKYSLTTMGLLFKVK